MQPWPFFCARWQAKLCRMRALDERAKKRPVRGAVSRPKPRFAHLWQEEELESARKTELFVDSARTAIARNDSPDVPFTQSINPYRGCEHGCIYCFARPTHAYLDLSAGIDFETKIFYKPKLDQLLRRELSRKDYRPSPIALGINTDAYQPVERKLRLTRRVLEVLWQARHPVTIVTKSSLILRDLDLLASMAELGLVHVAISIATLDRKLAMELEPRAASPERRLEVIARLADAGVPVGVMAAPVIPKLTEHELERILLRAREAGASWAAYVLLRLPHELEEVFFDWLRARHPEAEGAVRRALMQMRQGRLYDGRFGTRMTGTGARAELLAKRFQLACKRLGLGEPPPLRCHLFRPPMGEQLSLFD